MLFQMQILLFDVVGAYLTKQPLKVHGGNTKLSATKLWAAQQCTSTTQKKQIMYVMLV